MSLNRTEPRHSVCFGWNWVEATRRVGWSGFVARQLGASVLRLPLKTTPFRIFEDKLNLTDAASVTWLGWNVDGRPDEFQNDRNKCIQIITKQTKQISCQPIKRATSAFKRYLFYSSLQAQVWLISWWKAWETKHRAKRTQTPSGREASSHPPSIKTGVPTRNTDFLMQTTWTSSSQIYQSWCFSPTSNFQHLEKLLRVRAEKEGPIEQVSQ